MIRLRGKTAPFENFLALACALVGVWAEVVGGTIVLSLLFGPFAPLVLAALIMTLGLPIVLLVLWGRSLDAELGWGDFEKEPW